MQFYVLYTRADKYTYAIQMKPVNHGACPHCSACGEPLSGLDWLPLHRIVLEQTHKSDFGDVLFGPFDDMMVSERFLNAWEKHGLKGFTRIHPPAEVIKIIPKKRRHMVPPTYHLVNIVLSQTKLDEEASGVFREKPPQCPLCLDTIERIDRLVIDEGTWTGEDIFYVLGFYGHIIVTERFAEMCSEKQVRNAVLIPAEKYRRIDDPQHWDEDLDEWVPPPGWPLDEPWPRQYVEKLGKWDNRLETRVEDGPGQRGYEDWRKKLDKEVVDEIKRHPAWIPRRFEDYLKERYNKPDLRERFPNGLSE